MHAYGAVFDNPDLIAACVVGDGEAETGALATSWHSNKFLNPARDGAVLPILHLNGYKIANPTVLARISHNELEALFRGYGYEPLFVEGADPRKMHQLMASALDTAHGRIAEIQRHARSKGFSGRPAWPMIIFRSPKGWTGPREVAARRQRLPGARTKCRLQSLRSGRNTSNLEKWLKSYRPWSVSTRVGSLRPELSELSPKGERRMGANPHATADFS